MSTHDLSPIYVYRPKKSKYRQVFFEVWFKNHKIMWSLKNFIKFIMCKKNIIIILKGVKIAYLQYYILIL